MLEQDLSIQILRLLHDEQRQIRNSEITRELWQRQSRRPWKEHSTERETFKVKVTRALQRLEKENSVRKHPISHKNVAYSITEQGQQILNKSALKTFISMMPPVEVQVLVYLTQILISKVFIMAPYRTSLEEYIERLKEEFGREDIVEVAKALVNDPKKGYSQFYQHVTRYREVRMLATYNSMSMESQQSA